MTALTDEPRTLLSDAMRLWVEAGGGTLPVSGRSMRPTFEDPARVWMVPVREARFGDLIVYSEGSLLVVHRVVGVRSGTRYRTKGDGLPHLDLNLVAADRLLGRVVEIERAGRRVRVDGAGGHLYARLAGALSATEGFLYRFAYRLDRLFERNRGAPAPDAPAGGQPVPSGGPMVLRRALNAGGRGAFAALDAGLFGLLHRPSPPS